MNRCVGSLPCRNGSSSRCTAAGCDSYSYIYVHTPSCPDCVEILNPWEKRRSGLGRVSVQTQSCIALTLNSRSEKVKIGSVCSSGSEVNNREIVFFMFLCQKLALHRFLFLKVSDVCMFRKQLVQKQTV